MADNPALRLVLACLAEHDVGRIGKAGGNRSVRKRDGTKHGTLPRVLADFCAVMVRYVDKYP